MFKNVVSMSLAVVAISLCATGEVVPQNLGSIKVTTPMYTADQVDEIVSEGGDFTTNNTQLVATIEAVSPAPSTNNAAFVQAVRDTAIESADASDLAEIGEYGTYGTVGAAILALIAGLAAIKRRMGAAETAIADKRGKTDLAAYTMSDWYNGSSASNEVAFRYDETSGEWIGEPGIIYAEGHRLRYNVAEGEWQYVLSSGDVIGLSTDEGAMELRPAGYLVSRPSVYVTTADTLAKTSQLQDRYTKAEADAKFVSSLCINVTWSELVAMRNSGSLVSGERYRITDYVATTNGDMSSQSANHPFDIIVTADSPSRINEHARAAQHAGDQYFSDRGLHAWDVWYCLDNDVNRFAWASSSGKGVVYRLVDEWGNDLPYDFKGIRFTRDGVAFYTFDAGYRNGAHVDVDRSLNGSDGYVTGNVMKPYTVEDNSKYMVVRHLNNNVCFGYAVEKNSWDEDCHGNTLGDRNISTANCSFNVFGKECRDNSFGPLFLNNSLGAVVHDCTYVYTGSNPAQDAANPAAWCQGNTIGPYSAGISMVLACSGNVFDYGCLDITLAQNCKLNSFGAGCSGLSLGTSCLRNTFTHGYKSESPNPVIEVPNGTNRKVFTTADDAEATSGALKKVALTGAYSDLVGTPSLDDAVTRTSTNGVKSSGIWLSIWGTLAALPSGFSSLYDWCVAQFRAKRDYGDLSYERKDSSEGGWILHIGGNDVRLLPAGELTWTDTGSETDWTYNMKWLSQWHLAYVAGSSLSTCVDQESQEDATELTLVSTSDYETVVATATAVSVDDSLALSSDVAKKQNSLTAAQLAAANSGATAAKVATWDGYAAQIATKASTADLRYRIAEAGFEHQFAASAFPITYMNTITSTPVTITAGDAGDITWDVQLDGSAYVSYNGFDFAYFNSTGDYGGSQPGVDLQFNGVSAEDAGKPLVQTVADRTVNIITASDETSIDIELPVLVEEPTGVRRSRDLIVRLDLTALATAPKVTFAAHTGETVTFETEDGAMPALEAGKINLVSLKETAAGIFAVAHKVVQRVV